MFALCEALQTSKTRRSHSWDVKFYDLPLRGRGGGDDSCTQREKKGRYRHKNYRQVSKKAEWKTKNERHIDRKERGAKTEEKHKTKDSRRERV